MGLMLLGVELLDELVAGVPAAGSPAIQAELGTSYAATAGVLLLVPALVALVLEPLVFLAADRWPRRWFVRGGLAGMAVASLLAAIAPGAVTLAIAISLSFVASGSATALAQATLVDRHPDARERVMTRWMLWGLAGGLGGPLLLAGLDEAGLGWRAAFAAVGAVLAAWCALTWRVDISAEEPDDDEDAGVVAAIELAIRDAGLLRWLAASALCNLLDDILVVFASLHLRDDLGAGPGERAIVLGAFIAGGAVGVVVADRALAKVPALRVLRVSAVACAVTYVAWLGAPTWWLSALGMLAVGATTAPLYPIVTAQAYAALPGRSGAVNAAGHLFTPFSMLAPWLLGLVADRAGVMAALVVLLAQPLGILALATPTRRRR